VVFLQALLLCLMTFIGFDLLHGCSLPASMAALFLAVWLPNHRTFTRLLTRAVLILGRKPS
jgi:hypothetical protein